MRLIILTITTMLLISVPLSASDSSLLQRVATLEERVAKLEALLTAKPDTQALKKTEADKPDSLKLTKVTHKFIKGDFSSHYEISYTLENTSEKDIKLIKAGIQFSDLLGENVYGIKIKPDLKILKGKSVTHDGQYRINSFRSSEARMKDMTSDDIVKELIIEAIVYSDNSVFKPE